MGKRLGLSAVFMLLAGIASANVSLRTGNFFIGYRDIFYSGGFEPKIERVYNSKSSYKGMFGPGWGTEYEAYLRVAADGSVTVYEYGGGAENRFSPVNYNPAELEKATAQIFEAAKASGALTTPNKIREYQARLKSDVLFRNDEWEKLISAGKMKRRTLPESTQLYSNRFSYQYITRVKAGYQRTFDNGKTEIFDDEGKLAQVVDRNNNFIKLGYTKDGKIQKIEDNFLRKMFLTFNSKGLLEKVEGEGGLKASYQYNDQNELVTAKDSEGGVYTYEYSKDNYHNLKKIGYADKTTMEIEYNSPALDQNVKQIKDRDGTLTEYSYQKDKADPNHTTVGMKVKSKDGKAISSSSYEYFNKIKTTGESWTYRLISVVDEDKTDTIYNECCGLPIVIKKGSEETKFKYDKKGRVVEKETPTELTKLAYDAKIGKVTTVQKLSKSSKRQVWSQFQYDAKGNLVFARNSAKKGVKLLYDRNGRIATMVDESNRRIDFKYNENSKPIEITDPKLGSIKVSYTNTGEVKSVDSSAGRKIAVQVTTAFQNLLDIIRPAGVTLAF